ncbi:MAG: tripartite tricarboxylate transporter substrate binding protein [Burkholderiales bacterium]|nr:tripartite tricarboxylate transporter substrate binding protein [Burkholderiales bacterium]
MSTLPSLSRRLARIAPALAAALFLVTGSAIAQSWPNRPLRLVVPYVPGGATDLVSRTIGEQLTAKLGQQVVVDNRPGATGTIAFTGVAEANPDGYTLITTADSLTLLPYAYRNLKFDPRTSFTPISMMSTQPLVLAVHAAVPAKNVKEFLALAKAKSLSFATSGTGTSQHLSGELIKKMTGIDMVHIPYKGGGQAIIDLSGGQVPAAVLGSSTVIPQHKAGRVRILAVTSKKRSAVLSEVPTLDESGLTGFDVYQWTAMLAPAKTPKAIIAKLNNEVTTILKEPVARDRLRAAGFEPQTSSPEEVSKLISDGMAGWGKLIAELKLDLR